MPCRWIVLTVLMVAPVKAVPFGSTTNSNNGSVADTWPATSDTNELSGESTTMDSVVTDRTTLTTHRHRSGGVEDTSNATTAGGDRDTMVGSITLPGVSTETTTFSSSITSPAPASRSTTINNSNATSAPVSSTSSVANKTTVTDTSTSGIITADTIDVTDTTTVSDTTAFTTTNTTEVTDTNSVTNSNTSSSNSGGQGCAELCSCPNYEGLANALVPGLRAIVGKEAERFTDQVIRVFLLQQMVVAGDNPKSILFPLLRQYATSSDINDQRMAIALNSAMDGETMCNIPENVTFVLNAAVEARLFPQVAFKTAFLASLGKARNDSQVSTGSLNRAASLNGELVPTQLYNLTFICKRGARVVIAKDSSLYRYGRWSDNCNVSTEGVLVMERDMSLIKLIKMGGTTEWLHNITVSNNRGAKDGGLALNSSSSDDLAANVTANGHNFSRPALNTHTIFPRIRDVSLWNTTLSVRELSDMLGLFQKATTLDLKNTSLEDFNCSQLLPAPASWTNFTLSNTGLKSVPACLLRPSLINLQLPGNAISDITLLQYPRFVPAPRLYYLDLSDNHIDDVGILTDMNISYLILAGNRISSLNKVSFARLPELSWLDLSRNRLQHLEPGTFKSLVLIQHLDLQHNYLHSFHSSFRPLRNPLGVLRCNIFLNHNRFSHPPFQEDGYDPGSGMSVSAADNPYACDCDMELYAQATVNVSLEGSYADRAMMTCQHPASLRGHNLDTVAFNDTCPVVMDCPEGCVCSFLRDTDNVTMSGNDSVTRATEVGADRSATSTLTNAVTVDCSGVKEFQQPRSLPDGYPLYVEFQGTGDMNETSFSLQDADYLLRIVSLNLSGRGLTQVPEFLCEALPQAKLLDLSFNKLTRLPDCFQDRAETLPTLELRLAGNPWSCDCNAVSMRSWMAELTSEGGVKGGPTTTSERGRVVVSDAEGVWCSASSQAGKRVGEWDTSVCEPVNYLPWVLSLGVILGLAVLLGPLLYVYRLQAMVAIHAHLHVRPFTHVHHFKEADYDHEALVVHGASERCVQWVVNKLLPRVQLTRHRLCVPDRDFLPGASIAESCATAVARSKATVCLLSPDTARDEWWLYAFQLARAQHARCPHTKLLLVWLEEVEEEQLPEEVRAFLKTNTYLSVQDGWFWKKLFFYLPDPPKTLA